MSFSADTKNEICTIEIEDAMVASAELSGLFHTCGSIHLQGNKRINFAIRTENAAIARRAFKLLKYSYAIEARVVVKKNKPFKNRNVYSVIVSNQEGIRQVLLDLNILKEEEGGVSLCYAIPEKFKVSADCRRAVVRGAFLGGGSISNPNKAYHLEFACNTKEYAQQLAELVNGFGLHAKVIERKSHYIVYLKESEQIVTVLNIIGAHQSLMNMENIRIMKDMRNNVNRIVNCETANLSKTVEASYRQIAAIEYIKDHVGWEKLSPSLSEVAELRLNNRDASLKELGEMLNPPVGKSGINHRLKKIEQIARSHGFHLE